MNNHLKLSDFTGKILANAILLGPIAIVLFLLALPILDAEGVDTSNDLIFIFFFGGIFCVFASLSASMVIYGVLVSLALRKQGSKIDHFKRFLPVLVILFPIGSTPLLLSIDGYSPFPIAIMISAYLTSVLGWYWLSGSIAKKQRQLNLQSNK